MIPYSRQVIDEADIGFVVEALQGDLITTGPWVDAFESRLADYSGAGSAVVVNSGTAALHAAYAALGIGKGDKLITSPLSFVATANAAHYLGAEVVFADIDPKTGLLDPNHVSDLLDEHVKVVTCVDYAGQPCDYSAFRDLQQNHHFHLVADACHSFGGAYKGARVGSLADVTCLSFHPVKPITTAEGGAVLTNNSELAQKLRVFRSHGIVRNPDKLEEHGDWYYEMQTLGYNFRMPDIQAALGQSQLSKLDAFISFRRSMANHYRKLLHPISAIRLPEISSDRSSAFHLFPVLFEDTRIRRMAFDALREAGFGVQVHYIPVYWQPYYEKLGYRRGLCPHAEAFYSRVLSLPLWYRMEKAVAEQIVAMLQQFDLVGFKGGSTAVKSRK